MQPLAQKVHILTDVERISILKLFIYSFSILLCCFQMAFAKLTLAGQVQLFCYCVLKIM